MAQLAQSAATTRRNPLGLMPAATTLDDESNLDFSEGVYSFLRRVVDPISAGPAEAVLDAAASSGGIESYRAVFDGLPHVKVRNRLHRSTQEMMWRRIMDTYDPQRVAMENALKDAAAGASGCLELDETLEIPEYFADAEFHIQPGSYDGDSLSGLWYHYGTKIVFLGENDNDEVHHSAVAAAPVPENPQRIVDLGCSIGQSSTALKERFPQAQVTGIDIAAPMLQYAHWRAAELDSEVVFSQQLVEATNFDAESVDAVFAFLLFHELPQDLHATVVAEAHRILAPDGRLIVIDNSAGETSMRPYREYTSDFSRRFNGEAFAYDFNTSDFLKLLKESPFASVGEQEFPADVELPFQMWVCQK